VYNCIQLIFLIIVLISLGAYFSFYITSQLKWDATSFSNNPINDTINVYTLEMLTTKSILNILDILYYDGASNYLIQQLFLVIMELQIIIYKLLDI